MSIEQFENRTKSLLAIMSVLSTNEDQHMKLSAIQLILDELMKNDNVFLQLCNNLES